MLEFLPWYTAQVHSPHIVTLSMLSVICVLIEPRSDCGSYGPCSAPDVKESSADQGLRAQEKWGGPEGFTGFC